MEPLYGNSRKKKFVNITMDTKLADLQKFFELNSVAFVTDENRAILGVVTKIDLLTYLLNQSQV
jgi:cystathionine beta-synthase